jgi:hypothetical protein
MTNNEQGTAVCWKAVRFCLTRCIQIEFVLQVSGLRSQVSGLRSQVSEPRTQNPEPRTQNLPFHPEKPFLELRPVLVAGHEKSGQLVNIVEQARIGIDAGLVQRLDDV